MYAQTICYGLFAARCNTAPGQAFTRDTAAHLLPKTNPFLRKMFGHIAGPDLDSRVVWAVDDLVDLLNRTQINLILRDFGKRTRQEDPVVHFYETFLAAYDPKMRESRGVYYTPEPVVSYIVRSVHHLLKTDFGLPDGLADSSKISLPRRKGAKLDDEFLKVDFPRIPLPRDLELFRRLCHLGGELVSLHLLESPRLANPITRFSIGGDCQVVKPFPKHLPPGSPEPGMGRPLRLGRVYINSSSSLELDGQYFDNVPTEVWDFHIGGYRVCERWLKERRGRTLTSDDITHYQKVVTALAETIRLMQEIDSAIPKWPIQ